MTLSRFFNEKIVEVFAFVQDEYGFKFDVIYDYMAIARKGDINLYFIFDQGIFFSVEIELIGKLGDKAIKNPHYRKLGASTMAECINNKYRLKVKRINNEDDLLSEMEEEARVLREYCANILAGDVTDWHRIVNCLLKKSIK